LHSPKRRSLLALVHLGGVVFAFFLGVAVMAGINAVHHLGSVWGSGFRAVGLYFFILLANPIWRRWGRKRSTPNREGSA
jgi:membrane protein implicated in regulation of membrane protease activity